MVAKKLDAKTRTGAAGTGAAAQNQFSIGKGKESILPSEGIVKTHGLATRRSKKKEKSGQGNSDGVSWESPNGFLPGNIKLS